MPGVGYWKWCFPLGIENQWQLAEKYVEDIGRKGRQGKKIGYRGMAVGTKVNSCCRVLGGRVIMERPNGAIDEKILGLEGSRKEWILSWWVRLGVPSMRYMVSPETVQIITFVIISGTRVTFESIWVTACPTWRVGTAEREGGLSCLALWFGKEIAVGGKLVGYIFILFMIRTLRGTRCYENHLGELGVQH